MKPMKPMKQMAAGALGLALGMMTNGTALADTFGTGANTFTIDFVGIGNTSNEADTTNYGAVPYAYRVGTYEISQDAITKATASGMANVTAGAWSGTQPAASISWYEAAAFVNWLNTSRSRQRAYDLTYSGGWSMNLWSSDQAWEAGGVNLYRHKDAFYFLPSENEWYKAAYYNPGGSNYFLYPTASDIEPTPVASGTSPGTAVYKNITDTQPAIVDSAGGLSPYGTMGQGGNVVEWTESAYGGANNSSSEDRTIRGGDWNSSEFDLLSVLRSNVGPSGEGTGLGFRVASVPEPSTAFMILIPVGAWLLRRRRSRSL